MTRPLIAILSELGDDELEVLAVIAERLLMGQRAIGVLDIEADRRDWNREALDEVADAAVYSAIALVREQRRASTPPPNMPPFKRAKNRDGERIESEVGKGTRRPPEPVFGGPTVDWPAFAAEVAKLDSNMPPDCDPGTVLAFIRALSELARQKAT